LALFLLENDAPLAGHGEFPNRKANINIQISQELRLSQVKSEKLARRGQELVKILRLNDLATSHLSNIVKQH
jgi:hypothetical protein